RDVGLRIGGELVQEEDVAHRAHAEEHMDLVSGKVICRLGASQYRHHPGDAAAAGDAQDVARETGIEGRSSERPDQPDAGARGLLREQPLRKPAAGLPLHDELETLRRAREVHHRIAAPAAHAGRAHRHELARIELARGVELDLERRHVVRQGPDRAHRARERTDAARAGIGGIDEACHLDRHVALRRALAHEELAALGLDEPAPRGLGPGVVDRAVDELRLAGAAGAGGALVGQAGLRAQAGVEDFLPFVRLEVEGAVSGAHLDAHALVSPQNGTWEPKPSWRVSIRTTRLASRGVPPSSFTVSMSRATPNSSVAPPSSAVRNTCSAEITSASPPFIFTV